MDDRLEAIDSYIVSETKSQRTPAAAAAAAGAARAPVAPSDLPPANEFVHFLEANTIATLWSVIEAKKAASPGPVSWNAGPKSQKEAKHIAAITRAFGDPPAPWRPAEAVMEFRHFFASAPPPLLYRELGKPSFLATSASLGYQSPRWRRRWHPLIRSPRQSSYYLARSLGSEALAFPYDVRRASLDEIHGTTFQDFCRRKQASYL
jgi:hypothetical protein